MSFSPISNPKVKLRSDGHDVQCAECFAFGYQHQGACSQLRPFPVQDGGYVPWWLAEIAYAHYADEFGRQQSLEKLAERGGFGVRELVGLLRGES